jgi:hypothetical protein
VTRLQAAQAEFPGLAETMTRAEFARAGLDKLSAEELAVLDAWIRQMTTPAPADDAEAPASIVAEQDAASEARKRQIAAAEAAARAAEIEAEAALAAAAAAEAEAQAQAEAAAARQAAAEVQSARAAETAARAEQAAQLKAEAAATRARELEDQPFQDGRWVGPKPDRIESRIAGEFEGWRGDTIFVLDNGQVWRQRQNGKYFYNKTDPEIVISRNILGFFVLEVVESGKSVGVKRLR